jgi:hypothetical protein
MKMSKGLFKLTNLAVLTGTMLCSSITGAAEKPVQGGTIPIMKKAPVMDGVINQDEWKDAIKTEWFQGLRKGLLDPREGSAWVGCDKDKLYIAVSSELPPTGKPIATVKVQDGPTIHDSSIELWVDPFLTERLKDASQPLPYYQFIGNSLGFVFDTVFTPGKAASDAWNGKWEIKNNIDTKKNRWDSEIAIKWEDLGVKPGTDMSGKDIGLIISRNWKNPWEQSVWLPCSNFVDPTTYPRLRIDNKAPVVQLDSMGDIFKGKFDLKLNVINPSNAKIDYALELDMVHSDMPTTNVKKNLSVEPGKNNLFAYKFEGDGFHPDAKHTVTIKITSPDQKQEYFFRKINWAFPVEKRWKAMGLDQDAGVKFAYYPSLNKIRVQIDPESALGKNAANELRIRIKNKDEEKNKKKLFDKTVKLVGKKVQEFAFDVPDFDDGTYNLSFEFLSSGKKVKITEKNFERIHYAWEKCRFGITDKVYPPFTPIKVEGNKVDVVLRQYELDKLGLPQKIIAKGHDILAPGGMKFNYLTADNKVHTFSKESGKFIETKGNLAVYEGQAESADLKLKAKSAIEYDGCAKVELEITPVTPGREIKEFYLDIPLKKKYAVLWHICEASLRSNPAGAIPEGKGIIWDSTQTGNGPILGNFLPYVWLGRAEEGIAWFADSDKGWIVEDNTPELQIIRADDGNVSLRVRFINKPVKLEKATSLVFGWQASPTKPMPADFRKPKTGIPMHGGSNRYWGIRPSYAGKYPAERDYEFADQLLINRKRGKIDYQYGKKWFKKHYGDVTDEGLRKSVGAHIGCGLGRAADILKKDPRSNVLMLYFEEHCQDQTTPEWRVFQDEWGCKDFTGRKWHDKIMANDDPQGVKIIPTNSYQNFAMWEELEWLKRGIGIYCDNVFLRTTTNLEMSKYAYKREDGNIQPGTGLWDMREYHKRMWVLVRQMQEVTEYPLYISLHMTNGNLLPIMTWTDINLDIEWSWNGGNDPFPPELLRAETTGLQTGCYPHALHQCTSNKWFKEGAYKIKTGAMKYNPDAVRHDWGIQMVHEILRTLWGEKVKEYPLEILVMDFGYGEPDCKVYNYWQDDYPVSVSNKEVKSIAFEKDGKVMVVLTSWLKEKAEISVALQGALSKYASLKAVDPETGKAYEIKDGKVLVPMDKWGVRLIVFGGK